MKLINVILPPERKDFNENGIKFSVPNCATVTLLITDNNKKILFDSGAFGYADKLVQNLNKLSLTPDDIDYVILSHAHFDHNANLYLFNKAQLIYDKWLINLKDGRTQKFGKEFDNIPQANIQGIQIIKTPGHTEDSISIISQYQGKKYAVVGDALKISILKKGIIDKSYSNPTLYRDNMNKICNMADVVISGEDGLIVGDKLLEVKKLLREVQIEK